MSRERIAARRPSPQQTTAALWVAGIRLNVLVAENGNDLLLRRALGTEEEPRCQGSEKLIPAQVQPASDRISCHIATAHQVDLVPRAIALAHACRARGHSALFGMTALWSGFRLFGGGRN